MHTFSAGPHAFEIAINVTAIKRVRDALAGFDLLSAPDGEIFTRLAGDPILLCNVLYVLCRSQCDAAGLSDEQFGELLAGDALEAATTALLEELVDFFPQSQRSVLKRALEKRGTLLDRAATAVLEKIDSPLLDQVLDRELAAVDQKLSRLAAGGNGSTS